MRSLLFDELRADEIEAIKNYLISSVMAGPIEGLFWVTLPDEILTREQKDIKENAGPFKIAIELGKTWLKFELLIRTSSISNMGGGVLNIEQFLYIYNFANKLSETLNLTSCK
ncbi:MAG: hypothetical protein LBP22_08490 [Deltaproteobacteria bacterium]|jgi:hypothetical protein|nr:hypothetical protein [Deltaproteobacteria bacterium]